MTPDAAQKLDLYERALKTEPSALKRSLSFAWNALAYSGLLALAWAGPFGGRLHAALAAAGLPPALLDYVLVPLAMALRGVLLVEVFGHLYHRFFQHLGWLTRRAQVFRRNQRFHWIHHMIIYPIGRSYRRAADYVESEDGAWSWVVPGLIVGALFTASAGLHLGTFVFLAAVYVYASKIVDVTHARFHVVEHPWKDSPYFHFLEEVHLLHHWDQRYNFTIVHPLMDVVFGTYLAPEKHREEMRLAMEDRELTASDLINWRYLLLEASPAEYAAFISAARQHPRSLRKVGLLLEVLRARIERRPGDEQARELRERALRLLEACGPSAQALLAPAGGTAAPF